MKMEREKKCISLDLAKQIDAEHKRLGIEVESEWWWCEGQERRGRPVNAIHLYPEKIATARKYNSPELKQYPAYDTAELGEMLPVEMPDREEIYCLEIHSMYSDDDRWELLWGCRYEDKWFSERNMVECLGKMYLWLLQNGYIKGTT